MTRPHPRVLLALALVLLSSALLAACGGSGDDGGGSAKADSPQALLEKTFRASSTQIARARVAASFRLDPEGLLKLGGPLAFRLTGPFAARADAPARFDFDILATLGGQKFKGGAISTGAKRFLRLDDRAFALRRGTRPSASNGARHGLDMLGLDPVSWVRNVRDAGQERVGGVQTTHLAGDVDARRLLTDVGALLDKAGDGSGSLLSPELLDQIAGAVKSAKVDVWTGADDSILRQIAVSARFAFKASQSPIVGLDGGKITLRVRLDDVNGAPVKVQAPAGAQPLSDVTGSGGLGAVLGGLSQGLTGGIGNGAIELVSCVTGAGGSSVELVRCISKLSR